MLPHEVKHINILIFMNFGELIEDPLQRYVFSRKKMLFDGTSCQKFKVD